MFRLTYDVKQAESFIRELTERVNLLRKSVYVLKFMNAWPLAPVTKYSLCLVLFLLYFIAFYCIYDQCPFILIPITTA